MAFLLCLEHLNQTKAYLDDNKWPLADSPDEFAYLAVGRISAHYICDVCQGPLSPGTWPHFSPISQHLSSTRTSSASSRPSTSTDRSPKPAPRSSPNG